MKTTLLTHLEKQLPKHLFLEVCTYLFKNPGKLFRPKLIQALGLDLKIKDLDSLMALSAFIEIHHTYTLIHDDLPAMDDDDHRRGQLSTHKKFGEASAILAGDALLISSFASLSPLPQEVLGKILKLSSWATGAKGLISGQFFDLEKRRKTFDELLRIHELKTARLFQICTFGSLLLKKSSPSFKEQKDFLRLGQNIGLIFQILDDFKDRYDIDSEYNNLVHLDEKMASQKLEKLTLSFENLTKRYSLEETYKHIHSLPINKDQGLTPDSN